MKWIYTAVAFFGLSVAGCVEQAIPTSPVLEQGVFNAIGGLRIGEPVKFSGAAAAQILIGGTAVAGDFLIVPFHASHSQGADLQVELRGENLGIPPMSQLAASGAPIGRAQARDHSSDAMHLALLERQQAAIRLRLSSLRRSLSLSVGDVPPARTDLSGGNARVDQLVQLNANAAGSSCETITNRTGRVEAISEHSIIVGDIGNPAGGFTRQDYQSIGQRFDTLVEPTLTRHFGDPTDIDQNDRVIIFFTRIVNELTTPEDDGFIGGFFWARDLFPRAECPASNAAEIFFVLAPDPNAEASHLRHTRERVLEQSIATVGHEYEHLINAGRRIYVNEAADFEEVWLDEGLAHTAEELLFYAAASLQPRSNLTIERVEQSAAIRDAMNEFGVQNLFRYGQYLEDVTRHSLTNSQDVLETRGAAWAFLRYAADHSNQTDEQFFRKLVDTPLAGINNLSAALNEDPLNWFQRWGVSIYTDDLITAGDSRLQQPSWHFRSLLPRLLQSDFPLTVETLGSGQTVTFELKAATSGYVRVRGVSGQNSRIFGTSGHAAPPTTLRVTVLRTN